MIDRVILFPYYLALKCRDAFYKKRGVKADIPTICIGNITVRGTGKTPHAEMLLRTLLKDPTFKGKNIAVLSRGYKRKTKGFQQVLLSGTAAQFGDEPLQIKRKFPFVTVADDSNRVEGCRFLAHPELLESSKKARKCLDKNFPAANLVVLDDAFQYRKLRADVNIVLVDYNRPIFKDSLMPLGRLRDLPQRIKQADIVIVSKCPGYLDEQVKDSWRKKLRLSQEQKLYFTTIGYCAPEPVFPEAEPRYIYSKRLVLFTGIANDRPLAKYLGDSYKLIRHLQFPDHHTFTAADIREISAASSVCPTALIATTEKDSQRIKDYKKTPRTIRERLFRVPIEVHFLSEEEREDFRSTVCQKLTEARSEL